MNSILLFLKKIEGAMLAFLVISLLGYHFIPYHDVTPQVQPYLQDFQVKMWDKCDDSHIRSTLQVSIKIVDKLTTLNVNTVGICHYRLLGFDITLREDFWNYLDDVGKRQLMYHELLHCYLNIDHKGGTIMDEFHSTFSEEDIEKQLDYFIDEVCKK